MPGHRSCTASPLSPVPRGRGWEEHVPSDPEIGARPSRLQGIPGPSLRPTPTPDAGWRAHMRPPKREARGRGLPPVPSRSAAAAVRGSAKRNGVPGVLHRGALRAKRASRKVSAVPMDVPQFSARTSASRIAIEVLTGSSLCTRRASRQTPRRVSRRLLTAGYINASSAPSPACGVGRGLSQLSLCRGICSPPWPSPASGRGDDKFIAELEGAAAPLHGFRTGHARTIYARCRYPFSISLR
jgi:hypothetical protein